jgi:hypothetical protein
MIKNNNLDPRAEEAAHAARSSFVAFRHVIRPDMLWGWWVEQISVELDRFHAAFVAGKRPKLAIMSPPQHGKSWAAEDFAAYVAGRNPDAKTIFASYSEDLGTLRNLNLQRTLQSPRYRGIFGNTRIGAPGWQRSTSLIEYIGHTGSFRNAIVGGPITGMELHLGNGGSEELSGVFGGLPCSASSSAMRASSALFCATNSSMRAVSPPICRSSSSTSAFTSSASESIFSGSMRA